MEWWGWILLIVFAVGLANHQRMNKELKNKIEDLELEIARLRKNAR